jgi:hypothetical protein
MNVGDVFGTLEVVGIRYRKRRDGTQGGPVLVDVRCKCGVERTVLPATLTRAKYPLRSCGGKGCRTRRPSSVKPESEIWYCKRRGAI